VAIYKTWVFWEHDTGDGFHSHTVDISPIGYVTATLSIHGTMGDGLILAGITGYRKLLPSGGDQYISVPGVFPGGVASTQPIVGDTIISITYTVTLLRGANISIESWTTMRVDWFN